MGLVRQVSSDSGVCFNLDRSHSAFVSEMSFLSEAAFVVPEVRDRIPANVLAHDGIYQQPWSRHVTVVLN